MAKRVTKGQVSSMQNRISRDLTKLHQNHEVLQTNAQLEAITKYLQERPELIPQAHAHIVGGMLEQMSNPTEGDEMFSAN